MQVDFYILETAAAHEQLRTACRLAEKAWHKGHRVFIHTDSKETARSLDDMLWTYRQDSFVPHALFSGQTELLVRLLSQFLLDRAGRNRVS